MNKSYSATGNNVPGKEEIRILEASVTLLLLSESSWRVEKCNRVAKVIVKHLTEKK